MHSDGQLYSIKHKGEQKILPPPGGVCDICESSSKSNRLHFDGEELLIIGLIVLLISDKCNTDFPLILALLYILFSK